MADRLEQALDGHREGFVVESDLRVDENGRFLDEEDLSRNPELKHHSPYVAERDHVLNWIEFLRHCGGFEVW
jgi:hypothetical protein